MVDEDTGEGYMPVTVERKAAVSKPSVKYTVNGDIVENLGSGVVQLSVTTSEGVHTSVGVQVTHPLATEEAHETGTYVYFEYCWWDELDGYGTNGPRSETESDLFSKAPTSGDLQRAFTDKVSIPIRGTSDERTDKSYYLVEIYGYYVEENGIPKQFYKSNHNFIGVGQDGTHGEIFLINVEVTDSGHGGLDDGDTAQSEFELHYRTNGGKYLSVESESHVWVKDYEDLPVPVREGYNFEGWYWDFRLTDPVRGDVKIDEPVVVLYAKWTEEKTAPELTGVSRWLDTVNHIAYLSGYPDHSFGADRNMTRAEVAQMFYSLLLDKDVTITKTFTDVPSDAWYAQAVNTMASLGMLGGYPDGTFQPDRPITRAEFAVVALAFTDGSNGTSCSFTDVNWNDWFYQYVAQASQYGWMGGYPNGSFRPNNKITRAEVSVIVNNMLERRADARFIDRNQDQLVGFTDLTDNHWAYNDIMEATNAHAYTKDGSTEVWSTIK